ncbi:acyl-CoA desaturase [Actinokineospora sp. NBRC 105648]|uniref:fatty acid desaturase family protein n=1 Tax=Actinokineospora sp. NBRC 105648 TaxID=3032206 RepID=UPI0024A420F9|nr:acyl-CoA desaturase [Actinokineospora sp. NBRC 105648]GLZ42867.1 fatty acid desaturase [Actinokineospora sp. NBRC 105648]
MTSVDTFEPPSADVRRGSDFGRLTKELKDAGLLGRRYGYYALRNAGNVLALLAGGAAFAYLGESWWQMFVAAFLALVFTQFAFMGHDAGHRQIFRSHTRNDVVGYLNGAVTGISYQWWVGKHNRHHANPNTEDHDPDIEIPALAFSREQAVDKTGVNRWITKRQAYLFFPLLTLEAVLLRISGFQSAWKREIKRPVLEAVLLTVPTAAMVTALFLVLSPLQAVAFMVVHQAIMGVYLGCSFAPNHKGMPILTAEDRLDHLRKQVLTSRDIVGGRWVDGLFGGLNYQIEHHLYPHMPRANLRRAQPIVEDFCARHDIRYVKCNIRTSYAQVLSHLHDAGAELRAADAR